MYGSGPTTHVRIYANVSEVRKIVKVGERLEFTLDGDQFREMVPDTLRTEGADVLSQSITRAGSNRKQRRREEDDEADDACSYDVTFTYAKPGEALITSLVNCLTWEPKYELLVKGKEPVLKCIAVIKNQSSNMYIPEKTELFGGYTKVKKNEGGSEDNETDMYYCGDCEDQDSGPFGKLSDLKLAGVHKYGLPGEVCIRPRSTHYLEFMTAKPTVERLASLDIMNPKGFDRPFDSVYVLKADKFLPKGVVCLRGEDGIIGAADLNDLPAEEKAELVVGTDSQSRAQRKEIYKDRKGAVCTVTVELTLTNSHDSTWTFRYKERYSRYNYIVTYDTSSIPSAAQKTENGVEILIEIWPGRTEVFRYTMERERTSR